MNEQTNPEIVPEEDEPTSQSPSLPAQSPGEGIAFDVEHVKRVLEAALMSTTEPLTGQQLRRLFSGQCPRALQDRFRLMEVEARGSEGDLYGKALGTDGL